MNSIDPLDNADTYAVIGAGPSGLAAARNLQRLGIPWSGFELASDVGGLWDIDGPRSTVYESAHLISSKRTTEFTEFPMRDEVADYPSHRELLAYFRDFADHLRPARGLRVRHRGGLGPAVGRRRLGGASARVRRAASSAGTPGVVIANGTLSEPAVPTFAGSFDGEMLHTSAYKSPTSSPASGC